MNSLTFRMKKESRASKENQKNRVPQMLIHTSLNFHPLGDKFIRGLPQSNQNRAVGKDISNLPKINTSRSTTSQQGSRIYDGLTASSNSVAFRQREPIRVKSISEEADFDAYELQSHRLSDNFSKGTISSQHTGEVSKVLQSKAGDIRNRQMCIDLSSTQSLDLNNLKMLQRKKFNRILPKRIDSSEMDSYDLENIKNVQLVPEYAKEIIEYVKKVENFVVVKNGTLPSFQKEITEKMRSMLVDWLIEVHLKFKLIPETLFLAVNILDRFIVAAFIPKKHLQLVGITALFIAAKYEEIYPPSIKDFVYVTDKAYQKEELLEIEGKIISTLQFKLTMVSPLFFFERFGRVARLTLNGMMIGRFILDSILVDLKAMRYLPSLLAAAVVYIVRRVELKEGWRNGNLKSSITEGKDIRHCAFEIIGIINSNDKSGLNAAKKKYPLAQTVDLRKSILSIPI